MEGFWKNIGGRLMLNVGKNALSDVKILQTAVRIDVDNLICLNAICNISLRLLKLGNFLPNNKTSR
jgi:hypothetical protein